MSIILMQIPLCVFISGSLKTSLWILSLGTRKFLYEFNREFKMCIITYSQSLTNENKTSFPLSNWQRLSKMLLLSVSQSMKIQVLICPAGRNVNEYNLSRNPVCSLEQGSENVHILFPSKFNSRRFM